MKITDKDYIGQGRQKVVYRHPENSDLCIKFAKLDKKRSLGAFKREIWYICKHQANIDFINHYRGRLETNLGTGYLFDLIINEDSSISKPLDAYDRKLDGLESKVARIYETLLQEKAPVSEFESCNVLVKEMLNGDYELILIDGLGNSDFIKICDYSRYFLKLKLNRKFSEFCKKHSISPSFLK